MKNVVDFNEDRLRDVRDVVIELNDLVALATPGHIKTGRVIGFKPTVTSDRGNWDSVPPTVVVQCHEGCNPSFVRYSYNNLLCIDRLGEGVALT